MDKNFRMLTNS